MTDFSSKSISLLFIKKYTKSSHAVHKFYITKHKFCTRKFKMAAKISSETQKMPYFPSLSIYLAMQYMNFMLLDMSKSIF